MKTNDEKRKIMNVKNIKCYKPLAMLAVASGLTLLSGCNWTQNENTEVLETEVTETHEVCNHLIMNLGEDILIRECDGYEINGHIQLDIYVYEVLNKQTGEAIISGVTDQYNVYNPSNHNEMIEFEEEMIKEGKVKLYTLR